MPDNVISVINSCNVEWCILISCHQVSMLWVTSHQLLHNPNGYKAHTDINADNHSIRLIMNIETARAGNQLYSVAMQHPN